MAGPSHGAFGEVNRAFWDSSARVEKVSTEPWIQDLTRQIFDHLRSNTAWIGLEQKPQGPIRMLDYACGTGIASMAMLPSVTEIRGIDVSGGMVDKYNAEARKAGMSEDQMHAVRGDLLAPAGGPLQGQEFHNFDLIVMSMALHHVDEPNKIVAKFVERLKPGGTVVIIDWIPKSSRADSGTASDQHQHSDAEHTISFDGFNEDQMRGLFSEAGCLSSDFVLAESPSEVPPDPTGQRQLFFAKGIK
ncbi:MAG: hypothetical protein LQ341_001857 [Variospora aurantia]|nr:MAG: hypothetical protein LQ341_001857 [Variospora aurantia]